MSVSPTTRARWAMANIVEDTDITYTKEALVFFYVPRHRPFRFKCPGNSSVVGETCRPQTNKLRSGEPLSCGHGGGICWSVISLIDDPVVDSFVVLSATASLMSLTAISVERLLATWRPFRHRSCPAKYYSIAIALIWSLPILIGTLHMLGPKMEEIVHVYIFTTSIAVMLCTILLSYIAIWYLVVLHRRPVQKDQETRQNKTERRRNREQSKKLTKTLSIVTALSILTWVPTLEKFAVNVPQLGAISAINSFLFGNSLVNPIVYIFRMPEFRVGVKQLMCRFRWSLR